ncbi:MAG: TetR/AcrR family transcriptional regulator [Deltaproteobacteria bacterium]|nr:TetR/AcrR family transcriptional regulator [Deltaproteobacteria bacterium]MBI3388819.1 TetR/AcrR family transcriptional regulator [Deltaproteobacteria bacterium]
MRSALQKAREAPSSTKARILSAAEQVFASKGFEGASTREIAAQAGVNISSLHYHWESKETLYFAVFQNIYDRIVELVRTSIPAHIADPAASRTVVDTAMGRLFDFFADNPNIPKLMVRRLLESDASQVEIERDILIPSWKVFASLHNEMAGRKMKDADSQLFMLTIYSVLLIFLLDSRQYTSLLGGSVRTPELRKRVRSYLINLVKTLALR